MKLSAQIRRERLLELIREAGSQVAVAETIGKDKNQVYQWLLPPDAEGARNMGSKSARLLEEKFRKPTGWMDTDPEAFSGEAKSSLSVHEPVTHGSRHERLDPATIRTVHEMLRWRFDFEGQKYSIEAAPELFSLAYTAALSGSDKDRSALKAAVDAALKRGAETHERGNDQSVEGAGPDVAQRSGRGRG